MLGNLSVFAANSLAELRHVKEERRSQAAG